jgi:hypothetical protein
VTLTEKKTTKWILFCLLLSIALLFIVGAASQSMGRYELGVWGGGGIGFGAFVMDTVTGETKIVYLNTGMDTNQRNHIGKEFDEIP